MLVSATVRAIRDIRATFTTLFATFLSFATWCNVANAVSLHSSFTADNLPYEQIGNQEPVCIADEVPFEIPESWEWCRLGSISNYAEKKQKINARDADPSIWGLDLEDIEKGGRLLCKVPVGERKSVGDKTVFSAGDVLYSKLRPYLLKILVAPDDGICTSEIVPFHLYGGISAAYVVALLKSPYVDAMINSVTYGVKMPRVGTETMTSLLVPLPPIKEQLRIVEQLKVLAPYEDNYEGLYLSLQKLNGSFPDQLRKSILQYAVQGKLVPQNPDDEPASVLLDCIRAEKEKLIAVEKIKRDKHESVIYRRDNSHYEKIDGVERCIDDEIPFEIPENWGWARLKTIFNVVSARRVHQSDWKSEGIPFYRAREIAKLAEYGHVDNDLFISEELFEEYSKSGVPKKGDLMVTAVGTLGKTYIVKETDKFYYKDASVLCFENFGGFNPAFMELVMRSPFMDVQIKDNSAGTTVATLTIIKANEYLIPVPPAKEQCRIVHEVIRLFAFCKKMPC